MRTIVDAYVSFDQGPPASRAFEFNGVPYQIQLKEDDGMSLLLNKKVYSLSFMGTRRHVVDVLERFVEENNGRVEV